MSLPFAPTAPYEPPVVPMDLATFARLAIRLSEAGDNRGDVLRAAGLDEAQWAAIEAEWEARLDAAEEAFGDEDGVPPLVQQHADAFARAQAEASGTAPLDFDGYVEITRGVQRGEAVAELLEKRGLTLSAYLQSHLHWTTKMSRDPELARRFADALRRAV